MIGRFIEDKNEVKTSKTYIILTLNGDMVYKRVHKNKDDSYTLQ
ncbi:hypothetical protein RG47T_1168 [Mucilaginibacter polytrichastri]|uniref:Uncharacterized protein n=1 Tax=Mucilaginibacter polytrichastri TaxID=1302689 RepID=A0A1Q5ZVB8_9SPHI|nr:hypothetical protein RG47T_1168 [Mucilaginibacter polytrichastri]